MGTTIGQTELRGEGVEGGSADHLSYCTGLGPYNGIERYQGDCALYVETIRKDG